VKPAGNVAALRENNPAPRKSHATRLTQRQTQRRDKFWLFDRLLFSTDPDFENFVGLARMLNPSLPRLFLCQFCQQIPHRMLLCAHGRATRSSAQLEASKAAPEMVTNP
jgi:hypothetical protein